MFKMRILSVTALAALISVSAFAGREAYPPRNVTIEEFKGRCQDRMSYWDQLTPQAILIQCTDTVHEFVQDQSGSVAMPAARQVSAAFSSDKFHVEPQTKVFAMNTASGSCARFKEVLRTFTVEKQMGCTEVLGIKSDIQDYCAEALDGFKGGYGGKDGKYNRYGKGGVKITEEATGRMIDTCSANTILTKDKDKDK